MRHLIAARNEVIVLSDFPDVFRGLAARVVGFRREHCDVIAHYAAFKAETRTNQWEDVCRSAKINVPFHFDDWQVRDRALVNEVRERAGQRPLVLVHGGREPMGRTDRFGIELLPERAAFATALDALRRDCFLVQIGHGAKLYLLDTDWDLNGNTTVADLLDLASVCAGVVAQCSFCVPLAEAFDKPLLAIWASRGLRSATPFIRQTTPQKVLSKTSSRFVRDDETAETIGECARAFRDVLGSR